MLPHAFVVSANITLDRLVYSNVSIQLVATDDHDGVLIFRQD